eukprot:c36861_g1_i1.p1 GENE.c36861_g1_i1~~c36861_g1_i1.p1  ORF type:complete len:243 (-),score=77.57 c36861_g1_i1:8-673(-)
MNCLLLMTAEKESNQIETELGVSSSCILFALQSLTSEGIKVTIATINHKSPSWKFEDNKAEEWVKENQNFFQSPLSIQEIDGKDFDGLFIPTSIGGLLDLAQNVQTGNLIKQFIELNKPIACVGQGTGVLASLINDESKNEWKFKGYHLTGTPTAQEATHPYFSKLPIIVEDFCYDNGAHFSASSEINNCHVVVDRKLVTGQNIQSTELTVQNLIWLMKKR